MGTLWLPVVESRDHGVEDQETFSSGQEKAYAEQNSKNCKFDVAANNPRHFDGKSQRVDKLLENGDGTTFF